MNHELLSRLIRQVDSQRIRDNLFYLSKDPLPFRKLNHTSAGHEKCSLYEADDFLEEQLTSFGYKVEREAVAVQAVRCDPSKPKAHQYSPPLPEDPWYTAFNLYARKAGSASPEEIILVVSHKDSQSWVDSPGANDNAVGTVGNLEMARLLAEVPTKRSFCFLFCNEEHSPWTSVVAANNAKERGDNVIAVFNLDGLGAKSREDQDAGRKAHVTAFSMPEGERLACIVGEVNDRYSIGLEHSPYQRPHPNDDDGSFVKAGYPAAVLMIGSFPYADPNYHCETDTPEYTDLENVTMSVQLSLASALTVEEAGAP